MSNEKAAVTVKSITLTEEAGIKTYFVTLQDAAERETRVYIGKSEALALSLGLQHSSLSEDYLLAHEFCVVAASQGIEQAKWLAAASEDRFLHSLGRPQRFGTQLHVEVSPGVEDSLRVALNVPTLLEAKIWDEEMNEKLP